MCKGHMHRGQAARGQPGQSWKSRVPRGRWSQTPGFSANREYCWYRLKVELGDALREQTGPHFMGTTPGPELSSAEMSLGPLQQLLRRRHRKTHNTTTVKGRGCVGPGAALSGGLLG